jgi:GH15 family glucan-1,4-alpha-glucosidase
MLLQTIVTEARSTVADDRGDGETENLENIGFWKAILESILNALESCSESNSPDQVEELVRNYKQHALVIATCRKQVKRDLKTEHGPRWRRVWRRDGAAAVDALLEAASQTQRGTIATIARNPLATEVD